MAKLHTICGNCGCGDDFLYSVESDIERDNPVVYISCNNCGTLHDLEDNARQGPKYQPPIHSFYDDAIFNCWVAMLEGDIGGLTLTFGETELQTYQDCYGYCVFEGLI